MTALAALPEVDRTRAGQPLVDADPTRVILLADDDVEFRYLARAALESAGFHGKTLFTGNGTETLDALERAERSSPYPLPDLILLDLYLPDVDGEELVGEVKCRWGGIPIVVITASNEADIHQAALEAGASAVFSKPASFLELVSTFRGLSPLCDRARSQRASRTTLPQEPGSTRSRWCEPTPAAGSDQTPRSIPRSLTLRRWH